MYQYNLKFGRIDTFFLCCFKMKDLIDINTMYLKFNQSLIDFD